MNTNLKKRSQRQIESNKRSHMSGLKEDSQYQEMRETQEKIR
jgi:hypothetical protein